MDKTIAMPLPVIEKPKPRALFLSNVVISVG